MSHNQIILDMFVAAVTRNVRRFVCMEDFEVSLEPFDSPMWKYQIVFKQWQEKPRRGKNGQPQYHYDDCNTVDLTAMEIIRDCIVGAYRDIGSEAYSAIHANASVWVEPAGTRTFPKVRMFVPVTIRDYNLPDEK